MRENVQTTFKSRNFIIPRHMYWLKYNKQDNMRLFFVQVNEHFILNWCECHEFLTSEYNPHTILGQQAKQTLNILKHFQFKQKKWEDRHREKKKQPTHSFHNEDYCHLHTEIARARDKDKRDWWKKMVKMVET